MLLVRGERLAIVRDDFDALYAEDDNGRGGRRLRPGNLRRCLADPRRQVVAQSGQARAAARLPGTSGCPTHPVLSRFFDPLVSAKMAPPQSGSLGGKADSPAHADDPATTGRKHVATQHLAALLAVVGK